MRNPLLSIAIATVCLLLGRARAFVSPDKLFHASERCQQASLVTLQETSGSDSSFFTEAVGPEAPKMQDVVASLLLGSQAIYTFASVRAYVNNTINQFEWEQPSLIFTQDATKDRNLDFYRYLRFPVSMSAVHEFIDNEKNYGYLMGAEGLKRKLDTLRGSLEVLKDRVNADIVEFDDKFQTSSLVYAITVNRTNKRIAVIFRGSVTGGKDWFPTNVNLLYKRIEPTDKIDTSKLTTDINVHTGFYEYLFAPPQGERKFVKFDQIVNNVRELYSNEEYKDYNLYISGHSLGGALTQLLAFELAMTGKLEDVLPPGPITAVTFESPRVGNEGYSEAFRQLERKGRILHARFTNEFDVVPVIPFTFLGYRQTGLSFHLRSNRDMEIGFGDTRTFLSVLDLRELCQSHGIFSLLPILEQPQNVALFEEETISGLYEKYSKKAV